MLLWFFYVIIFNEHFLKTDFIIFEVCNFYAFIIIIIFFFFYTSACIAFMNQLAEIQCTMCQTK